MSLLEKWRRVARAKLAERASGTGAKLAERASGTGAKPAERASGADSEAHLRSWTAAHEGVEAFVEPRTAVTETTVLLVDKDGGWTRRRIAGPAAARRLARSLAIPVYDVTLVGYPQRMRDHDARERILRRRAAREN